MLDCCYSLVLLFYENLFYIIKRSVPGIQAEVKDEGLEVKESLI
jgi:hypothetical protein